MPLASAGSLLCYFSGFSLYHIIPLIKLSNTILRSVSFLTSSNIPTSTQFYWKDVAKIIPSFLSGLNRSGSLRLWVREADCFADQPTVSSLNAGQFESWSWAKQTRAGHYVLHDILPVPWRMAAVLLTHLTSLLITCGSFLASLAILKEKQRKSFFRGCFYVVRWPRKHWYT